MTRNEENRLIAEKCENWTFELVGMLDQEAVERGYGRPPQPAEYGIMTHPDYFTDIAACVRAAEAWKTEDFNYRRYSIESVLQKTGVYEAIVSDLGDAAINVTVFAGTPAASLAAALVEAVK